jgi:hypothetical protein
MEADQTLWIDFEMERLKLVMCDSTQSGLAGQGINESWHCFLGSCRVMIKEHQCSVYYSV